jgi:hypothetical protein
MNAFPPFYVRGSITLRLLVFALPFFASPYRPIRSQGALPIGKISRDLKKSAVTKRRSRFLRLHPFDLIRKILIVR